jgi:hypothetical protein
VQEAGPGKVFRIIFQELQTIRMLKFVRLRALGRPAALGHALGLDNQVLRQFDEAGMSLQRAVGYHGFQLAVPKNCNRGNSGANNGEMTRSICTCVCGRPTPGASARTWALLGP